MYTVESLEDYVEIEFVVLYNEAVLERNLFTT